MNRRSVCGCAARASDASGIRPFGQAAQQAASQGLQAGPRFRKLASGQRHEVRKALKKFRYSVEFFQSLYAGKRLKRYLDRLEGLQDDLVHLNDVATARDLTERLKKDNPRVTGDWRIGCGVVMGWHTQAANILEPYLLKHWDRFAEAKPFWR
jgi:CHAD domain-containing protein